MKAITYNLIIPTNKINARFNYINDESELMKSCIINRYNFTDHFSSTTEFYKLTSKELINVLLNLRDLASKTHIDVHYMISSEGAMSFTIVDVNDSAMKDTLIIWDKSLIVNFENALQIRFTKNLKKLDNVDNQNLNKQLALLGNRNESRYTNFSINQDELTLTLQTSEFAAILKGINHIEFVANKFHEHEWIASDATPLTGRSYKSLFISPFGEIVITAFTIDNESYIQEYTFYLKVKGNQNSRINSLLHKPYQIEQGQLLETLLNIDRKKKIDVLLQNL
jgi:hypothetical protein